MWLRLCGDSRAALFAEGDMNVHEIEYYIVLNADSSAVNNGEFNSCRFSKDAMDTTHFSK